MKSPTEVFEKLRVPSEMDRFASVNQSMWDTYRTRDGSSSRWTVVDFQSGPHSVLAQGIFGSHCAKFEQTALLGLLSSRVDRKSKAIAQSFGFDDLQFLNERERHLRDYVRSRRRARGILRDLDSPADLVELRLDGIPVGDLVYNTYLRRTGACTVSEISRELYPYLVEAVHRMATFERIFDSHPPAAFVSTDIIYSPSGIPARMVIKRGGEVFTIYGDISKIGFKRAADMEAVRLPQQRVDRDHFEQVLDDHGATVANEGRHTLESKVYGPSGTGPDRATEDESAGGGQRQELPVLDPERPTVVVMTHVFSDSPRLGDNQLFIDYHEWLTETVSFAATQTDTDWLVKDHPLMDHYECQQRTDDIVADTTEGVDEHTVTYLPADVDLAVVADVADLVITVRGTPGIEFPALGIPCVVAGVSRYSGFGFTEEPASKDEYFDLLADADAFDPLTEAERQRARAMYAFLDEYMSFETELIPAWNFDGYGWDRVQWADAAQRLAGFEPTEDEAYAAFEMFFEDDMAHVVDLRSLVDLDGDRTADATTEVDTRPSDE
jgi:hypothetical protein